MRVASIDIGINGCLAITDETFTRPTLVDNLDQILTQIPVLLKQEGVRTVVVEEPLYADVAHKFHGITKGFVTTWYNFGRLMQTLEMVRPNLEIIRVQPKSWQAPIVETLPRDKQGARKKWGKQDAADYLVAKFPSLQGYINTPKGKLIDGRSDALCIADWFFNGKIHTHVNEEEPAVTE